MAWDVKENCLEVNVILIKYEFLTLQGNLDKAGMLYS